MRPALLVNAVWLLVVSAVALALVSQRAACEQDPQTWCIDEVALWFLGGIGAAFVVGIVAAVCLQRGGGRVAATIGLPVFLAVWLGLSVVFLGPLYGLEGLVAALFAWGVGFAIG